MRVRVERGGGLVSEEKGGTEKAAEAKSRGPRQGGREFYTNNEASLILMWVYSSVPVWIFLF